MAEPKINNFFTNTISDEHKYLGEPIVKAIKNKDLESVRKLIKEGLNINKQLPGAGKSPLHVAVEYNDVDIVAELIAENANVNSVTIRNFTPLHVAAQKNNTKIIEILVNAGANINCLTDVGTTPLHEAASMGRKAAVVKLIELNADPNIKDSRYNLTAANLAHENMYLDIVNILNTSISYQQRFIQDVKQIFIGYKTLLLTNPAAVNFVTNISNEIRSFDNADKLFLKVKSVFESEAYKQMQDALLNMRKAIIIKMKEYNQAKLDAKKQSTTSNDVQFAKQMNNNLSLSKK